MKKIISVVLVIVLVFSFASVALAADVPTAGKVTQEEKNAFEDLQENGLNGVGSGWSQSGDVQPMASATGDVWFTKPTEGATYAVGKSVPIQIVANRCYGFYGALAIQNVATEKWVASYDYGRIIYSSAITNLKYLDTSKLKAGKYTAYFFVTTGSGGSGSLVNGASVNFKLNTPKPAKPAIVKAAARNSNSIKVTWSRVSGATGYEVWRSATKAGGYKRIKTITNGTTNAYYSGNLRAGTRYYYKVRTYKMYGSTKVYSAFSGAATSRTKF